MSKYRKLNKSAKYTVNGAVVGALLNGICNAIKQCNNQQDGNMFNWQECFKTAGKGALIGGATGFILGTLKDTQMKRKLLRVGGATGVMNEVLARSINIDSVLPKKAEKLQKKLSAKFRNYLSDYPSLNGSFIKGTDVQSSDIDIQVKFNRNSGTIKNVRNVVENYFNQNFYDPNLIEVRNQNYSVGLVFDVAGDDKRIDIVPMREIENVRKDAFLFSRENNSIRKTNSKIHNRHLNFTAKQKRIIKLLKELKKENEIEIPSIFVEHLVKRAFHEHTFPSNIYKSLLVMLEYISSNILTVRIVDPANSNNVISDLISHNQKELTATVIDDILGNIRNDERNLLDYFYI